MRIALTVVIWLVALVAVAAAETEPPKPPVQPEQPARDNRYVAWQTYSEARQRARTEDKPLLLHFELDSDGRCRRMISETYRDTKVIRILNEHFAMTRVDVTRLPSLAGKYEVNDLPTLWFVDPDGRRLTHFSGFLDAKRLVPLLEFIHTGAYETTDFENWLKQRS